MQTLRIGRGPRAPRRPLPAKLGMLVDRITSFLWAFMAMAIPLAPYIAMKPVTNLWWWP